MDITLWPYNCEPMKPLCGDLNWTFFGDSFQNATILRPKLFTRDTIL